MSVLFPYLQETYNKQTMDILRLYLDGKIVFCPNDGHVENVFCVEQALRCAEGEAWRQKFSETSVESATRMIESIAGAENDPYLDQLLANRRQLALGHV